MDVLKARAQASNDVGDLPRGKCIHAVPCDRDRIVDMLHYAQLPPSEQARRPVVLCEEHRREMRLAEKAVAE